MHPCRPSMAVVHSLLAPLRGGDADRYPGSDNCENPADRVPLKLSADWSGGGTPTAETAPNPKCARIKKGLGQPMYVTRLYNCWLDRAAAAIGSSLQCIIPRAAVEPAPLSSTEPRPFALFFCFCWLWLFAVDPFFIGLHFSCFLNIIAPNYLISIVYLLLLIGKFFYFISVPMIFIKMLNK